MCSLQGHERGSGRKEERAAPLAEHLNCAPQQYVTEMGANRFDPSHQVAPRNGTLVTPLQIQISLPLLTPHPARPVPNAFAHFKYLRKQMFAAAITNLTSHQSVRAEDVHIIFTSVTSHHVFHINDIYCAAAVCVSFIVVCWRGLNWTLLGIWCIWVWKHNLLVFTHMLHCMRV